MRELRLQPRLRPRVQDLAVALGRAAILCVGLTASAGAGQVSASNATGSVEVLFAAAKAGDVARVSGWLKEGRPVTATEPDGTTALHWASRHDRLRVAELLVEHDADVNAANRYGVTPLGLAVTNGNPAMVKLLLDAGADVHATLPGGDTILMIASRTGEIATVRRVLAAGAVVDATESWRGQTALMWAAAENHVDAIQALIAAGAHVETRSNGGLTALHFAVREGHIPAAVALVAAGADVNRSVGQATSPLALAVINAHFELAARLLEMGADPNAPDARGSVLHALAWMRRPGAGRPPLPSGNLDSLELGRLLLDYGADPNARIQWREIPFEVDLGVTRGPANISVGRNFLSFVGATPFYLAAKHADVEYMRLLASYGADPMAATDQDITPLMAAAGVGFWDGESPGPLNGTPETVRLEAVKLAIELGNDIHAITDFGATPLEGEGSELLLRHPINLGEFEPQRDRGDMRWGGSSALHGAAMMGSNVIVEYLVERGANVDARNALGWTPRMVAEGVFVANTLKAWPETAALLERLEAEAGRQR